MGVAIDEIKDTAFKMYSQDMFRTAMHICI